MQSKHFVCIQSHFHYQTNCLLFVPFVGLSQWLNVVQLLVNQVNTFHMDIVWLYNEGLNTEFQSQWFIPVSTINDLWQVEHINDLWSTTSFIFYTKMLTGNNFVIIICFIRGSCSFFKVLVYNIFWIVMSICLNSSAEISPQMKMLPAIGMYNNCLCKRYIHYLSMASLLEPLESFLVLTYHCYHDHFGTFLSHNKNLI